MGGMPMWLIVLFLAAQPATTLMTLNVGGGSAGSDLFQVALTETHRLTVTHDSLPIVPPGRLSRTQLDVELAQEEAERIITLAKEADDFAVGCDVVADGTSAVLTVTVDRDTRSVACHNAAEWPQGQRTRALLDAINHHLPDPHKVF
jgi:hypothetical protein